MSTSRRPHLPHRGLRSRQRARSWWPMTETLAGKWVWVWNWRRCDGGDPAKVAARLRTAGCRGALIKAHDGPRWFAQGRPPRRGGGGALARRFREQVGPAYPLYYSSFAIARYHRSFPYASFDEHCHGAAPQVYWNAFRWPVAQAVRWTYEDYAALGTPPQRLFPVAGLYSGRGVPSPPPADVAAFAAAAARSGSPGISFWSYEHMNDAMWDAVRAVTTEEESMSSLEFQQLSAAHAALAGRVSRLETDVGALRSRPPAAAPARRRRTHT